MLKYFELVLIFFIVEEELSIKCLILVYNLYEFLNNLFHDGYHLKFDNEYECMVAGYKESLKKIVEIGPEDVNTHSMYIKFGCYPVVTETDT